MKNPKLLIFLSLGILISCTKEEEPTVLFEVFEHNTSFPLESVQIDFLKCTYYDWVFGCQTIGIVQTGYTDKNGRYYIKERERKRANEGTKLRKNNYWDTEGHAGINYLAPEAWIRIQLIPKNVYPYPILYFGYYLEGKSGYNSIYTRINPISISSDTTVIIIRAFGNQVNNVKWQIGSGSVRSILDINIIIVSPVLAEGILTQSPGRLDTSSGTILY